MHDHVAVKSFVLADHRVLTICVERKRCSLLITYQIQSLNLYFSIYSSIKASNLQV